MKIIRNEKDYDKALLRIEELIDMDLESDSELLDELEVLSLLVEKYEDEIYPVEMPDPIEAIKFRMSQMGYKNSDLIPYIGSKSKVSEVLNSKRKLSLSMIRNLNKGFGIPAEVLISDPHKKLPREIKGIIWSNFPLAEMLNKGWIKFDGTLNNAKDNAEEIIRSFFSEASYQLESSIFFRKSVRSNSEVDEYALSAWHSKALIEEKKITITQKFNKENVDETFFVDLRKLSFLNEGPILAREFLLKYGIKLVIVTQLKKTHIDGATFYNKDHDPIIALTLRYDRIDNFWFTLFHELSHIVLHLSETHSYYFDDLKADTHLEKIEIEADNYAQNMLITKNDWVSFYSEYLSSDDILNFANKHRISPAIIAGRIQKKRNNYKIFRQFLGQSKLKELFQV